MNANEAIKSALDTAEMISMAYLEDLTDEEMMVRPIDGCNHIKWQVGHLIASENKMINSCCPGTMPDLPAGFADRYASCLLYTSPSPRDRQKSRMPSSA